jgi:pimeloyl-ACP methyl ester carboxylesterase
MPPVEPQTVSVAGGKFNPPVYRSGQGEPLLWLHGAAGMSRGFTPDLEALAKHYDVIAPVHPGFDDTEGLEEIDDIHDLVFYYQDFVEALGLERFNLAGHSLGGMFAAEFAAARPDLVKKLVLVAPVGLWIDETPVTDFFALLPNEIPGVVFGDLTNPIIPKMFPPPANDEELADMLYMQMVNFSATGKFIWPIPDKGLKKRLHRIKAPTLIIWGEQDKLVPPAYGPLFASKIAKSQLVTIPTAGHMVAVEKTDEYVKEITAFLG